MTDALGRPLISEGMKRLVDGAFAFVPEGKRGALIVFADEKSATVHAAAKLGDHWKVAGGAGVPWTGAKPSAWVSVQAAW